jgi:hypothetical protein
MRVMVSLVGLCLVALLAAGPAAGFIKRSGIGFVDGNTNQPFRYGGTNNYYLHYKVGPPTPSPHIPDVFFFSMH